MPSKAVLYSEKDHVALVTLNRPEKGNVIDGSLSQELLETCLRINQNDDIYVAVVTGTGDKGFCAGNEVEQLARTGTALPVALKKLNDNGMRYEMASAVAIIDKPVIAAINGDALGQGLELALSCDIRMAAASARFGFPDVASGLMPMDGGTQRLPRIIGKSKALEMILSGQVIGAEEALDIGLVTQVVPGDVTAAALAVAQNMATKAPIAMRYVKEAVNKGLDMTLEQGIRLEADLYFLIHTTSDRTEGIKAFQEKRKPTFKGS